MQEKWQFSFELLNEEQSKKKIFQTNKKLHNDKSSHCESISGVSTLKVEINKLVGQLPNWTDSVTRPRNKL